LIDIVLVALDEQSPRSITVCLLCLCVWACWNVLRIVVLIKSSPGVAVDKGWSRREGVLRRQRRWNVRYKYRWLWVTFIRVPLIW